MDGRSLGRVLSTDAVTSQLRTVGVLCLEELPRKRLSLDGGMGLIVNTEPNPDRTQGEHWVALYGDEQRPDLEYFDSYGQPPFRSSFHQFFNRQERPWTYNKRCLQSFLSSTCGYYCLYYLIFRSRGESMSDIGLHFGDNTQENDAMVMDYLHSHYDIPRVDPYEHFKKNFMLTA